MRALLALQAWGELLFLDVVALFGFSALHRLVARTPVRPVARRFEVTDSVDAMKTACLFYFKPAKCLQRSAVVTRLLRRRGIDAQLVIGCLPAPMKSHAWVEVSGDVVCEHRPQLRHYRVLDRW